ncbi:MAG: VOC family protein [Myxococcota bacterium]
MELVLRQICLVAPQLGPAVECLTSVLGIAVCYRDPGVEQWGLENAVMPVGDEFLEVVAPTRAGTAAGRYLERRGGPGGYMVITLCDDAGERDQQLDSLGVEVAFRHRTGGMDICQLHPASTGGSFFEIDWQPELLRGPDDWGAAGGPARVAAARRSEVVTGISAAELQSPEPGRLAKRWAAIAGQGLEMDAAGDPALPLGAAQIRFLPCSDGRPEGLGGVDLQVADAPRLLAEAERRGCAVHDQEVELCGLRFRLLTESVGANGRSTP